MIHIADTRPVCHDIGCVLLGHQRTAPGACCLQATSCGVALEVERGGGMEVR